MKRIVVQILMLFCGLQVFAQSDRIDSLLLNVFGDDKDISRLLDPPAFYLYTGAICDSKTFYAGRELGDNMYTINGSTYLVHSRGYYIGASGSWYPELDPAYNVTVLSAGIIKPLNNLSFRASYSRYFFNNADSVSDNAIKNNLGIGLTLRNKWIGGRLSFNALFGNEFGINLAPSVFANITLVSFGTINKIFLAPEISAFIGSETIEYESGGSIIDPLSTTYITTDKYGLLNTLIYLPVRVYIGDFDFEFGYSVNIPTTMDTSQSYPVNSFLSFSIGYMLQLN